MPSFETASRYTILNISNYRTYAAIQYGINASYIIVPFSPFSTNEFRTLWLLHECGHIGIENQTFSLHFETRRILAMAIMTPVVFFAFPGAFAAVVIIIRGWIFLGDVGTNWKVEIGNSG